MPKFYPPQKINLVEREEWKPYDVTGNLSEDIFDSACSTISATTASDIGYYAELFLEKGKRKKVHLTHDQRIALFEAFKSNDPRIEIFRALIRDTAAWAWEEALVPTASDLRQALKAALSEIHSHRSSWTFGDRLEEIKDARGYEDQMDMVKALVAAADVSIEQKEGRYDRFLVFDIGSSPLAQGIATQPNIPAERGVLDWVPPSSTPDKAVLEELTTLFNDLKGILITELFRYVEHFRKNVDFEHRCSYWPVMKTMLKSNPEVDVAAKELRDFLASSPSLGANPFMNPRNRRLEKDFLEMKALAENSPILEFEALGDPPTLYHLRFHGRGLDPKEGVRDLHEITLDLGSEYPRTLPIIRWRTPHLHPNVAGETPCFGTFAMNPRVRLVDVVEILWDMVRMAIYNAYGHEGRWAELRKKYNFPLDPRTIRGEVPQVRDEGGSPDLIIMGGY